MNIEQKIANINAGLNKARNNTERQLMMRQLRDLERVLNGFKK